DLFGNISNSFILYVYKVMPINLYEFFVGESSAYSYIGSSEQMISLVLMFFDRYSIYGLSVENLGALDLFIKKFEKTYQIEKNKIKKQGKEISKNDLKFIEFYFKKKKHLVSPENILNNIDRILAKDTYQFYSLSMVLLGGLGPQGHGFTYSTPKGELIEICSDVKENEAIIIKYKQFLKEQFLVRLKKEMAKLNLDFKIIQKIINYLLRVIDQKELINYFKKEPILKEIKSFLNEDQQIPDKNKTKFQDLVNKISNSIDIILRPINMIDQFKCRMNLVEKDKIKSEDIAKLTSLKEKSHYDVLRERFFFQYIVKWFHQICNSEKFKRI
ncbi:MAG: hypothetical protein ACFFAN_20380, partial [Promethearchaeota archaeon]